MSELQAFQLVIAYLIFMVIFYSSDYALHIFKKWVKSNKQIEMYLDKHKDNKKLQRKLFYAKLGLWLLTIVMFPLFLILELIDIALERKKKK